MPVSSVHHGPLLSHQLTIHSTPSSIPPHRYQHNSFDACQAAGAVAPHHKHALSECHWRIVTVEMVSPSPTPSPKLGPTFGAPPALLIPADADLLDKDDDSFPDFSVRQSISSKSVAHTPSAKDHTALCSFLSSCDLPAVCIPSAIGCCAVRATDFLGECCVAFYIH